MKKININRKTLYLVLFLSVISVFTLTIAYASLSTILEIKGNAEVAAANWDIHLDNVEVDSGSVGSTVPTITNATTASFTTTLNKPGDYYQFTIDVVNAGTIDAMIDSVTKMPELTTEQAKYIEYVIEYASGESLNTKQLVQTNSFVRLKVKVKYRNDISTTDLPTESTALNLSFKINYIQSDNEGSIVENNGELLKIVSGNLDTPGSELCIAKECFYVMSSTSTTVTMLAKYNLNVGYKTCANFETESLVTEKIENPTGLQDINSSGTTEDLSEDNPCIYGTTEFSQTNYWVNPSTNTLDISYGTEYPAYVYNQNSSLYTYVEEYKEKLTELGVGITEARLITYEELESFGCDGSSQVWSCTNAPSWIYLTTYHSGSARYNNCVWGVRVSSDLNFDLPYNFNYVAGVRPVIVVQKNTL